MNSLTNTTNKTMQYIRRKVLCFVVTEGSRLPDAHTRTWLRPHTLILTYSWNAFKNKLFNLLWFLSILSADVYFFAFFDFPLFCEYFDSRSDRKLLKFCSLDFCRCWKYEKVAIEVRKLGTTFKHVQKLISYLKHHHETVTLIAEPQLLLHFLCFLSLFIGLEGWMQPQHWD